MGSSCWQGNALSCGAKLPQSPSALRDSCSSANQGKSQGKGKKRKSQELKVGGQCRGISVKSHKFPHFTRNVVLLLWSVYGYWEHKPAVGQEPVKPVHCPEHPGNTQPHPPWKSSPRQNSWAQISPPNQLPAWLDSPSSGGKSPLCPKKTLEWAQNTRTWKCGPVWDKAVFAHCHWKWKLLCFPWIIKKKKAEKKTISCCIPAKSMESPGTSERKMEQGANYRWELRKGQERNLHILKDWAESLELPEGD